MADSERLPIILSHQIIPEIAGAGSEKPEWSDVLILNPDYTNTKPVGPNNRREIPNPLATVRQDLRTVIDRKIQLINEGLVRTVPNSDWNDLNSRQIQLVRFMRSGAFENFPFLKLQFDEIEK